MAPTISFKRRWFVILASGVFLAFTLGCMSLSFGGRNEVVGPGDTANGVVRQDGTVEVPPHQETVVFYPIPYASTPNLTVLDAPRMKRPFHLTEQRPDGFRVKNDTSDPLMVDWSAKGVRLPPPLPGTTIVTPPLGEAHAPVVSKS
jgi:hypothetical protein